MIQTQTFQDVEMLVSSVNTQHVSVNRGELFASKCSEIKREKCSEKAGRSGASGNRGFSDDVR
jgi:hypothetical protein